MKENGPQKYQISSESGVDDGESSLTESQKGEAACGYYSISRPVYNKAHFLVRYDHDANEDSSLKEKLRNLKPNISCKRALQVLLSFVPLIAWLPKYNVRHNLPSDIAGGLTVGVMNIPQGLAYALLASLPPIVGLYTSFIPVLVYAIFGTSKHIAIGTFAIVSTMVGEVCEEKYLVFSGDSPSNSSLNSSSGSPWSAEDDLKISIAVSLTLLVGIIQAAMGLINLGFITAYLSRPLVSGFTTGAACIVFTSQVKYFFGIAPPRYPGVLGLPKTYIHLFKNIGDTNVAALITGLLCVVFLVVVDYINRKFKSRLKYPIPSQLLIIIIGAGISYGTKLNPKYDVSIVGSIPKGLPKYRAPEVKYFVDLIVDAFLIAIVAATTNLSLVKLFAQKHEYKTDSNQDLVAYGVANIAGSCFSCFVSSGSLSRSVVQETIGKTQIVSLISSVMILLVLLFMSPLFEPLPKPVLAAIVVVSLRRLFEQFRQLREIWQVSQVDAVIWFISCFAVVFLGIVLGLIAGFAVTLLSIIFRSSRSNTTILGHVAKTEIYKDPERCLEATNVSGMQIVKFEGPLIFVNAENFVENVLTIIREKCPDRAKKGTREVIFPNEHADNSLSGKLVTGVVDGGDKQIKLTMIRSLNPSSAIVSFNNMGSDDFTEEVTKNGADEEPDSSPPEITIIKIPCQKLHSLIMDFSAVTMIDFVGIRSLRQIIDKAGELGVAIYLASCSYYLYRHISRDAFLAKYINEKAFLSIHDAVLYVKKKHCTQDADLTKSGETNEEQILNSDRDTLGKTNEEGNADLDPATTSEVNKQETTAKLSETKEHPE